MIHTLRHHVGSATRFFPRHFAWDAALQFCLALLPGFSVRAVDHLSKVLGAPELNPWPFIVLVAGIVGLQNALNQMSYASGRALAAKVNTEYRLRHFQKITLLGPRLYEAFEKEELQRSRESIDAGHASSALQAVTNLISAAIGIVFLAVSLWSFSPLAAILSSIMLLPEIATYMYIGKLESTFWPSIALENRRIRYYEDMGSNPQPLRELTALGARGTMFGFLSQSSKRSLDIRVNMEKRTAVAYAFNGVITVGLIAASIAAIYLAGGDFSAMTAGIIGIITAVSSMKAVGYQIGELTESLPGLQVCQKIGAIHASPTKRVEPFPTKKLQANAVSVQYGEHYALHDATITCRSGEMTAIVGHNGAGKTTLVKAITGQIPVTNGTIHLIGHDDSSSELTSHRDAHVDFFGYVDQDFEHFELSIRDFLTLGCPRIREDQQLIHALTQVGLYERLGPLGLDAILGSMFGQLDLSGGQWQRLCLARLIVKDAPIWILDEPTSAVDAEAERQFFALLSKYSTGRIVIFISHRHDIVQRADAVHVISNGRVLESGAPETLAKQPSHYATIFGLTPKEQSNKPE